MAAASNAGLRAVILAPVVWAVHFTVIYVVNALACARGIAAGWVPLAIALATAPALLALLLLAQAAWRRARAGEEEAAPFLGHVGVLLCTLTLVALAWNVLPVLFVPAC